MEDHPPIVAYLGVNYDARPSVRPATSSEQKYLDMAALYVDKATECYALNLWSEAANHFGSAMESLLRIRYGKPGKLNDLVKKFDADPLFNNMIMHDGNSPQCATCFADRARILRNSVHPECWVQATKKDVDDTSILVLLIYHTLVKCSSKIAAFQESPDSVLMRLEATGRLSGRGTTPEGGAIP
jgi:hypothetical protein